MTGGIHSWATHTYLLADGAFWAFLIRGYESAVWPFKNRVSTQSRVRIQLQKTGSGESGIFLQKYLLIMLVLSQAGQLSIHFLLWKIRSVTPPRGTSLKDTTA